jgi:hypothetical protein
MARGTQSLDSMSNGLPDGHRPYSEYRASDNSDGLDSTAALILLAASTWAGGVSPHSRLCSRIHSRGPARQADTSIVVAATPSHPLRISTANDVSRMVVPETVTASENSCETFPPRDAISSTQGRSMAFCTQESSSSRCAENTRRRNRRMNRTDRRRTSCQEPVSITACYRVSFPA